MEQTNIDVSEEYVEVNTSEHSDTVSDDNSIRSSYCSICLETEEINARYIKFPCQHIFHLCCFEKYFEYNISHKHTKQIIECPICRKSLSTNKLKTVFDISNKNLNGNLTILIHDSDESTVTEVDRQIIQTSGCRAPDVLVIIFLMLGLTLFLLAIYKKI